MKELEKISPDKLEVAAVKPVKKESTIIKQFKPQPGQQLFEYSFATGKVSITKPDETNISYESALNGGREKKKVTRNPDCIYTVALNKRNAIKKFQKMIKAMTQIGGW